MVLILDKITVFVKRRQNEIILFAGVILISLFSFAIGYITAENQQKAPIRFEKTLNQ